MNPNQESVKAAIEYWAKIFGLDPAWACAVAMTESSLGEARISPTGCLGIFQMSTIAMEDLRRSNDDVDQILCGLLFLRLLLNRWGTIEDATLHFCDPADRGFYWDRVRNYMEIFKPQPAPLPPPAVSETEPAKTWWGKLWG